MSKVFPMEPLETRLSRLRRADRERARAKPPLLASAPIIVSFSVNAIDPAERARRRAERAAERGREAARLQSDQSMIAVSKAFISAIEDAEKVLMPGLETVAEIVESLEEFCWWPDDGGNEVRDPLYTTLNWHGHFAPRLSRIFAAWTGGRGGGNERSHFASAVKTDPAAACRLSIVKEARARFWDAMRKLRALENSLANDSDFAFAETRSIRPYSNEGGA